MKALAHRIILAGGWQRRLLACVAGGSGALAMAPFNLFIAMIVPMTAAVWLLDGAAEGSRRFSWGALVSAWSAGWWWGFGYFVAGLWWLGSAFLLDPDKYAWALPLGVLALPAAMAIYSGFGFVFARLLWSAGSGRVLALAAGLGLSEWLRGHLFGGFPWNDVGMAFGGNLVLGQAASVVGQYGLTLLVVAMAAAPATLADQRGGRRPVIVALVGLALLAGFGGWRLSAGAPGLVAGVKLRIMQPNVVEDAQFRMENKDSILTTYLTLSDRATSPASTGLGDITHLIWPETALPTILARDPEALARIGNALPAGVSLITGAFRVGDRPKAGERTRYFNAIQVVGHGGQVLDSYDKIHLVPFGEYLPLAPVLQWLGLSAFVEIPGDFEAGVLRKPLAVPGLPPVSPLICYEAIFSGAVMPDDRPDAPGPGLLLNVSNDSWFGRTPGPYQHLAQARLRAIEEGLPLVRAATTGLSAIVDPYGRIIASLPLGVADVLDSPLPRGLEPTFFSRHGLLIAEVFWILAVIGAGLWRGRTG